MQCPACGQQNPDGMRFCGACGARLALTCPSCGQELTPGMRFCGHCGTALSTTSTPPVAAPPAVTPAPKPALPAAFANGRYQVTRFLGEGGKKRVYLVHDTLLDRDVAFSLIKTQGLDEVGVERIRREARTMGRLGGHPYIVSVYDMGEEAGQPYLVSELMGGGDVEGLIEQAPEHRPPLEQTLRVADQVCQGLAYAHEHGIIHRDLKPGNVWLTKDGTAKLGDFGLAMATDKTRLSVAGMIVGTVGYMPPEQAMGRTADARSDLYSLGAMLYELVTGRPPFLGDDPVAIISQHVNTAPVAPSWHTPTLPKPLEALILALLAKDPTQRPASAADVRAQLTAIAASLATRSTPATGDLAPPETSNPLDRLAGGVFVGRDLELAALRAGVDAALSGQTQLLLLIGEPGIGKTRLAEELATYASLRSMQVLWGRNYEWEGAPPYWPWVQAIRGYAHTTDPQALRSELGQGAPDIAQLVSDIRERLPDVPSPPPMEPEQARFRLFDGITTFLKNASHHQPLLVILDDLHWADKPSLLLLEFVARELSTARVLVLGTYRDVEVGRQHPLAQTLAELSRSRLSRRVVVRGLPAADVGRFIELTAGTNPPPDLVQAVHQETEGNPFFMTEVVRLLVAEGRLERPPAGRTWSVSIPESVREVVGRRLSRLSEDCNQILAVGAVIGREFQLAVMERVTARSTEEVLELLDEAVRARLIQEQDMVGAYRFGHALVQETLYAELSTARRVRLHAQVGDALEEVYAANLMPHLAEVAQHYFQAAPARRVDKAIDYAVQAAELAMAQLAWEVAVEQYQRSLQVLDLTQPPDDQRRTELLLRLGAAQWKSGDPAAGRTSYVAAAALARASNAPELFARAALGYSGADVVGNSFSDAAMVDLVREALEALEPGDSILRVKLLAQLGVMLSSETDQDWFMRSDELTMQALDMARRIGDTPTLLYALVQRWHGLERLDTLRERAAIAGELIVRAEEAGDRYMFMIGHAACAVDCLDQGDVAAFDREFNIWSGILEEFQLPLYVTIVLSYRAMRAWMDGRLSEVEPLILEWERRGGGRAAGDSADDSIHHRFVLYREQGRLDELDGNMPSLDVGIHGERLFLTVRQALFEWELGRLDVARTHYESLVSQDLGSLPRGIFWLTNVALLGELCALFADTPHAEMLYELLLPYADHHVSIGPWRRCFGSAAHYLGLLATTMSSWDAAAQQFESALMMHSRMGARTFVTRTQLAYADMLVKRGERDNQALALDLVNQALAAAEEIGMTRLAEQALALKVRVQGILKA